MALTAGYTNNHNGYDFRIFESTNENVLQLKADAVGSQWVTFRAHYEYGSRTGSGLDEASLVEIGEQPQMRHYDLANRTRNRFVGQVDLTPSEALTLSVSAGLGKDDFGDSYFGLQEAAFRNVSLSADYQLPRGFGVGGTYNYERYSGLQRSRSASPGETRPGDRSQPRLDRGFQGARPLLLDLRCSRPGSAPTPRRASRTTTRTRAAITSMPSGRRCCRRRRSCRRPSTSCRTSGSTSGIA